MNDTSTNLPAVTVAGGLLPWVADLFEQHDVPVETGRDFAEFAIERYGDDSQDVVDRALMLVSEHDADLEIIGELLESNYSMPEIQICYDTAVSLDVGGIGTKDMIRKLIRFRRYFYDVQQSDDLAALIEEVLSDDLELNVTRRGRKARTVPSTLDMLVDLGRDMNLRNLDQVLARLHKE
jgi:hypothetical protein